MLKFIKHTVLWGLALLILWQIIAALSFLSLRYSEFYKPSYVTQLQNKSVDYIVLGSSTGLTTINTKLLDSLSSLNGLNLSMDDTALPTHYLMLQHFLAQGGTTRKVILSVTPWDVANSKPELGTNDHRFLPFIHEDYVTRHFEALSNEVLNPLAISYYFPFYGLAFYNTELFAPSLLARVKPKKHNRFDSNGNYVYPVSNFKSKELEPTVYKFEVNNPYLEKIHQICKQNQIELVLYQSPIFNAKFSKFKTDYKLVDHLQLLSDTDLFYDRIHVNAKGRREATIALFKQLN